LENIKEVMDKFFRKIISMLFVGVMTAMMFSCSSRKSEPVKQKEFASTRQQVVHGEQVYMLHCQKCHPAGEAGIGPSLNANPAPQFVKRFQMRHGLGVMPAFKKDEISTRDLRDISKYLKAWKHY
jgi:mono/diheme cytochrome c family protein